MAGQRISRTLPVGATIEDRNKDLWYKIGEQEWECVVETSTGWRTDQATNPEMDAMLARGAAEIVRVEAGLKTELSQVTALEVGEYVLLSFGWWSQPCGEPLFDPDNQHVAQQLWRVAGWSSNDPRCMAVVFDAPEGLMRWVNHLDCVEGHWETAPIDKYVDPGDVFHVVLPGQEHEKWSWDWSDEIEFVDPPD